MVLTAGTDAATLLSTALEKLLYLESRLEASEAARDESARQVDRLREASAEVRRTLREWQRRATQAEVVAEGAEREVNLLRGALEKARTERPSPPPESELARALDETSARLERLERERETWLDRMVALGRLRTEASDDLDLGSFIAELRAELMALRRGETDRKQATMVDRPPPPDARALLDAIADERPDPEALVRNARLPRPERTLAILCARDLESDAASVRRRSIERLTEAGIGALNPFATERLRTEPDALVRAATVALLDRTGRALDPLVIESALSDADVRVRVAAVEALARRHLLDWHRALGDEAPAVRRRVLALMPRTAESFDLIEEALRDDDASVRRVAFLTLSTRTGPEAVVLMQTLAQGEGEHAAAARLHLTERGLPLDSPFVEEAKTELRDEAPLSELDAQIMDEVRAALRGRTLEDLLELLDAPSDVIDASCARLVAQGLAVWRGPKLYPA